MEYSNEQLLTVHDVYSNFRCRQCQVSVAGDVRQSQAWSDSQQQLTIKAANNHSKKF